MERSVGRLIGHTVRLSFGISVGGGLISCWVVWFVIGSEVLLFDGRVGRWFVGWRVCRLFVALVVGLLIGPSVGGLV